MKEKELLVQTKFVLQKKLSLNVILSNKLRDLTNFLDEKTKEKEQYSEKLSQFNDEGPLLELSKEKAYLEASLNYLNEKLNNTTREAGTMSDAFEEVTRKNVDLENFKNELSSEIDNLKKELELLGKFGNFYY